ncbi:MAG TPA: cysteine-rich CWC family protein [Candidatus Angelobacter sp.]|nr:cysteine-rich CWC family protein [Candidatus Angelobacter sp.]
MNDPRIISFLPAATEMVCALGLADQLVGVTHECDYPPAARGKPVVVRSVLPVETMTEREIDTAVTECIRNGRSLYEVDERLLEQLAPTHILTQALCHVCAPSGNEITRALNALPSKPRILWFTPHTIDGIFDNLRDLGQAIDRSQRAAELIAVARAKLQAIAAAVSRVPHRPRVFCLEWTDPYYCSGHWVPEMVEMAGGRDDLGKKGRDSVRVDFDAIANWSPEVLIVSPCGFGIERAVDLARKLIQKPGWNDLPAVQNGRVFAVDANAYFARPGPRVVDGVELLASLIHPELFDWPGPAKAFQKISGSKTASRDVCVKRCSRCGDEFLCGPGSGKDACWCNDFPRMAFGSLESGRDCLCPSCLEKATLGLKREP